jgi:hypothetical protein
MDGCDGGFGYLHRRPSAKWKAGSVNLLRYAWRSPVRTMCELTTGAPMSVLGK